MQEERPHDSSARAAGVVLLALIVAVTGTGGVVHVAPRALVLVAAVVIAALALAAPRGWMPFGAIVAAVALGAASGHVLWTSGMPRVHDLMHVWGLWAYGRCVLDGVLYPLWVPYLGAGMPLLQFYGPLNFLIGLPGILAGLPPVSAWKLELLLGHVLSASSMLAGARILGVGWRGAILAAAAAAFAPWRLCVFDYRGALGEANSFLFLPLAAATTLSFARKPRLRTMLILAASVTGLVLTHLLSLFTLLLTLVPALLVAEVLAPLQDRMRRFGLLAVPFVLAAGLSAGWWIPIVAEVRHTTIKQTTADNPNYAYTENGVSAASLLERRKWDRVRVSIPRTERRARDLEGEQMPFYGGAVLLLCGLSAGWWSRRREAWSPAAGALLGLALSTAALAGLAAALPGFATLRFPWRFLSPATVLAGLALALGIDAWCRTSRGWRRLVPLAVLLACLVWDAAPYTGAADRIPPYRGVVHWYSEDQAWTHWDTSMQPASFVGELGELGTLPISESKPNISAPPRSELGSVPISPISPVRVRNLALPPNDYTTHLDSFFPAYYEWLTPEVYRYWKALNPADMAEAGVRYGFSEIRRDPVIWPARPYVGLQTAEGRRAAGVARLVARHPGRLAVQVEVAAGGATLLVREQAFPGWRARIDDGAWSEPGNAAGFMTVGVPAGRHTVELRYGLSTPARRIGLAVSTVALICVGAAVAMRRRVAGLIEQPSIRD